MPAKATWRMTQYQVNHGAGRRLFVEGNLDEEVMCTLLKDVLDVARLNGSRNLGRAAGAFCKIEPGYYFLIDRDHLSDDEVEQAWNNFLAGQSNVIYLRRKEMENYFLEPEMLAGSELIAAGRGEDEIMARMLEIADSYKYFFAAKRAYSRVKASFYHNGLSDGIPYKEDYKNEEAVLRFLKDIDFGTSLGSIQDAVGWNNIYRLYQEELERYTGGAASSRLEWDKGRWRDLMPGKRILNCLICNSGCFQPGAGVNQVVQRLVRCAVMDGRSVHKDFDVIHDFFENLQSAAEIPGKSWM